nr:DUF1015 domain-containing protein [Lachnospiraceae bacterium]
MPEFRQFKAVRPAEGKAPDVAALPYDVYDRESAKKAVEGDDKSFLRIDRPETFFDPGQDMYAPEVYERGAGEFEKDIERGLYIKDTEPGYYIYSLTMDGRTQSGIAGCFDMEAYEKGKVVRHENTRRDKEEDRVRHIEALKAQTGPVFLARRENKELDRITEDTMKEEPLYDFTSEDGVTHRVWKIPARFSDEVCREFADTEKVYIADGHHRCASACRVGKAHENDPGYEESRYVLGIVFPESQLKILAYNRVVKLPEGCEPKQFLEKLERIFKVSEASSGEPERKGVICIYLGGRWYRAEIPDEYFTGDPVGDLDVSVLQDKVLSPLAGIEDPRTDSRISFIGGIRGTKTLEELCEKGD